MAEEYNRGYGTSSLVMVLSLISESARLPVG